MRFCPGTITTHAESINSDLQRGLDRRFSTVIFNKLITMSFFSVFARWFDT